MVGGGYLGLWTAWQLRRLEPELDVVVLEAGLAGHGPSGRNGGFVSTLWDDLPILRERVGDERALAVVRASERGVSGIGGWCDEQGVDAWFREAPTLLAATSEAQLEATRAGVAACAAVGEPEEIRPLGAGELRERCDAGFLGGALIRTSATVHPARLSLGLRAKALAAGIRLHEHTPVSRLGRDASATTPRGTGPRRSCGARGEQRDGVVPRLPPRTRGRVEPHRDHRARSGRAGGARLDRR